ncbi:Ethylene-responsive transcription factor [Melia azedarach]|uniref:Ethylene-responsive transcription factor n=1 Tax=Melia azedarach TaxID=155640 RepID=A0ACC1XCJ4_MELAZ|nr:Ethylene-responsive transcription factor [Melia azedarach]
MVKTSEQTTSELRSSSSSTSSEPKYKGVRKRKWGKWVSEIRLPNSRERIWLGSYDAPEKAARAFDAALFCLRGPDAKFNFPDNPPSDIAGVGERSLTSQEIQVIAARFANEEPVRNSSSASGSGSGGSHFANVDSDMAIDWSFLSMLDSNEGASDFGLYSGMEYNMSMNITSDHDLYPATEPIFDDNGEDQNGFSQTSSFLWNF